MTIECKRNPTLKAISLCCFRYFGCCRPHRQRASRSLFVLFCAVSVLKNFSTLLLRLLLQRSGVVKGLRKMSKLSQFPPQTKCNQFESSTMASANGTKCAKSGPRRVGGDVLERAHIDTKLNGRRISLCVCVKGVVLLGWWAALSQQSAVRNPFKIYCTKVHLPHSTHGCNARWFPHHSCLWHAIAEEERPEKVRLKRFQCPKQNGCRSNNNKQGFINIGADYNCLEVATTKTAASATTAASVRLCTHHQFVK